VERLDKQMDFIKEIDKEKFINRHTLLTGAKRRENDAEHAWHASIMAILLSEYSNEKIDIFKTVFMILIHDIIEIYAGDTYAYDEEAKLSQKKREEEAAKKIFALLPDDQRKLLYDTWREFEDRKSPEAKFARVMDNIQPMMLNDLTGGKAWSENGVRLEQILKRNEKTKEGSDVLWEYAYNNFIKPNVEKGIIKDK